MLSPALLLLSSLVAAQLDGDQIVTAGPNVGAIAGGVVGGVLALALIAVTVWRFRRRARLRSEGVPPDPKISSPSPVPATPQIAFHSPVATPQISVHSPVTTPPIPASPVTTPPPQGLEETRQGSTLALVSPEMTEVAASQAAMWEKSGHGSPSSLPSTSGALDTVGLLQKTILCLQSDISGLAGARITQFIISHVAPVKTA
ncbi:hypothetical protein FB45DRAFT_871647 [Roridomyces roridus]|uniref:Uncharacterized protein n=1 Tax=Roridomyces roridus TaxID=1738132 RepID=A0AAD7BFK4_9AGAR|nr:hypothetical protein FB45DRAFT_871647 [Roridomyces roridus]